MTTDGPGDPDGPTGAGEGHRPLPADEQELLDAFDRLRPVGSLRWGFDDAMRRLEEQATVDPGVEPWPGLPGDLWERGRAARVGRRLSGEVTETLAALLADDARRAAAMAAAHATEAAGDALRYLAARVEVLEARADPAALEVAALELPDFGVGEWAPSLAAWVAGAVDLPSVVVGELGDGAVLDALGGPAAADRDLVAVDPSGPRVWAAGAAGHGGRVRLVLAEVADHLRTLPDAGAAGVVLAGCVDRLGLDAKLGLVDQAVRVTAPGGRIVLLVADAAAWEAALPPPVADLLPGRPLHPETWRHLLAHRGAGAPVWHRADAGPVHAVVAQVGR